MKHIKLVLLLTMTVLATVVTNAQTPERPNAVEIAFGANDSYGPYDNINFPLGIANTTNMDAIFQAGYYRHMTKFLDLGVALSGGATNNYYDKDFTNASAVPFSEEADRLDDGSHVNLDLVGRYKFFNDIDFGSGAALKFYLWQAIGANYYTELEQVLNVDNGFAVDVQPFGVGFKFKPSDNMYIKGQTGHKWTLFDKGDSYWAHTAAVGFTFGPPKPVVQPPAPVVPAPPADSDGDGIIDRNDDCPNERGTAEYNGCPPPPPPPPPVEVEMEPEPEPEPVDSDGDGIPDDADNCPNTPGVASNNGCPPPPPPPPPAPDTDGDGIPDSRDRCPSVAGLASNAGCPAVAEETTTRLNAIAKQIQFETNSNALKASSKTILDEVVSIMAQYPSYRLTISGHTDSVGDAGYNQTLSQRRAAAVQAYLASKGVSTSRMSSTGFGETSPIATNDTATGRAQNRRVELRLNL